MSRKNDFLSRDELNALRREVAALTAEDEEKKEENSLIEDCNKDYVQDMIAAEELHITAEMPQKVLSIEENGSYVTIDDDEMTAYLYLVPPAKERENYTKDELLSFLQTNGVISGYHQSNLAAMVKKKIYHREIVVAKGQPAVEGRDGYFEFKFDPDSYRTPKVLENGRVDYMNMSTLPNVRKGDVVAVYHHAKIGQDGYNVKGKTIEARKALEIPPLSGSSVSNQDNPDIYLATRDGKVEYKAGTIDIQAVHEVFGDVTMITGKVEFFGDVIIHGNVEAGVVIRAGRNIEIRGTAEAVNLFAGGDVILGRGIQGAQKAKISARGNIFADFIEHTVVVAGGNVQANSVLNSRISADEKVILTGNKGAIIGGYTHAAMGISATEIGNAAEVRTVVRAGNEKEVYIRYQEIRKKEAEFAERMQEIYTELEEIRKKLKAGILKPMESLNLRIKGMQKELITLKEEQSENRKEYQQIEELMVKRQNAEIAVNGNIYRGTVVCFAQMQIPIEHNTCYMKYFRHRGMIESSVIAFS